MISISLCRLSILECAIQEIPLRTGVLRGTCTYNIVDLSEDRNLQNNRPASSTIPDPSRHCQALRFPDRRQGHCFDLRSLSDCLT